MTRTRLIAFRTLTALLALMLFAFGGQLLFAGWMSEQHAVHELAWGVLEGLLMVVALVASLRRPERRPAAMQQVVAVTLALLVTMPLVAAFDVFTLVIAVWVAGLVALHPARSEVLSVRPSNARVAVPLAASAVLLIGYALDQAALQRGLTDGHAALDHYTGMAAAAVGLLFVLVAAGTGGGRFPARCAGLGLAVMGAAFAAFPEQSSSLGAGWGAATLLAGGAILATQLRRRPTPAPVTAHD